MTRLVEIHPSHPQRRALAQVAECVAEGGLIAYPTDACYSLGCGIDERDPLERIVRARALGRSHQFTMVAASLSEVAVYARLDNSAYRWLKALTPGPYTFILRATGETPRRVQHAKRRTIGVRIPDHPVLAALLGVVGAPLISSTALPPGETVPAEDALTLRDQFRGQVDLVIDAGGCGTLPTTVVDLTEGVPEVLRAGLGSVEPFQ